MCIFGPLSQAFVLAGLVALLLDYQFLWGLYSFIIGYFVILVGFMIIREGVAGVVFVGFSTALCVTLVTGPKFESSPFTIRQRSFTEPVNTQLPPILHIVLDEHIGIEGIPSFDGEYENCAAAIKSFYLKNGFKLHGGVYSRYWDTILSLSNLMNFSSSANSPAHSIISEGPTNTITKLDYFKRVAAAGYRFSVYQSSYLDFCSLKDVSYAKCVTNNSSTFSHLRHMPITNIEKVKLILGKVMHRRNRGHRLEKWLNQSAPSIWRKLPFWPLATSNFVPLSSMRGIELLKNDLQQAHGGDIFFAHLLLSHYPYFYDPQCKIRSKIHEWMSRTDPYSPFSYANTPVSREHRYKRYLDQLMCLYQKLGEVFLILRQLGLYEKFIIVVHGDHGSRIGLTDPILKYAHRLSASDYSDYYMTLFAVKIPGAVPVYDDTLKSLDKVFIESLRQMKVFKMKGISENPENYLWLEEQRLMIERRNVKGPISVGAY